MCLFAQHELDDLIHSSTQATKAEAAAVALPVQVACIQIQPPSIAIARTSLRPATAVATVCSSRSLAVDAQGGRLQHASSIALRDSGLRQSYNKVLLNQQAATRTSPRSRSTSRLSAERQK